MAAPSYLEHPERRRLVGELHARPFIAVESPVKLLHLVLRHEEDDTERRDRERLVALRLAVRDPTPAPAAVQPGIDPDLARGAAVPVVAGVVWLGLKSFRHRIERAEAAQEPRGETGDRT